MEWLHTEGHEIVDFLGRTIPQRMAMNFPWTYINEQYVQNAKAHGVKFIGVAWNPVSPNGLLFPWDYTNPSDIALMESKLTLLKQYGLYAVPYLLVGSTTLANNGVPHAENANWVINAWNQFANFVDSAPSLNNFSNETLFALIRPMDEPHLANKLAEMQFWIDVGAGMLELNPKLCIMAHTISDLRFSAQYWHLCPWHTPEEVPYPNMLIGGGHWVSVNHPVEDIPPDDYVKAAEELEKTKVTMMHFRDNVGIPCGQTGGMDENFSLGVVSNARTWYFIEQLRWCEQNHFLFAMCSAKYQLEGDYGANYFSSIYKDVPYSDFWNGEPQPEPQPEPLPSGCALASATSGTALVGCLPTIRAFRDRCLPQRVIKQYYMASEYLVPKIKKIRRWLT